VSENVPYVMWLRDCRADLGPQVGGKNAAIGEMSRAGVPIPPGFAVTTRAYEHFLDGAGIRDRIDELLAYVHFDDVSTAETAATRVRELITSSPLPDEVEHAIRSAYQRLAQESGAPCPPVAVRSSATGEDAAAASFAGQHDTFLWVTGCGDLMTKFKACISSMYTSRAICYRMKMGLAHRNVSMSVGVQQMVHATVAGVLLTLNPANGDRSKVIVEANWGLGKSVVGGEVTPDAYVVDKVACEIVSRVISPKTMEYALDPKSRRVVARDIPADRRDIPCMGDQEVLSLVRLAKLVEAHYGTPQNIEWAIDRGLPSSSNILLLQTRPETTWTQKTRPPVSLRTTSLLEHMIDSLKAGRTRR
jgi:pyruvate,water dikinase